ncbi:MAG: lactate utilization protein [Sphingobacteriia bacterium]|nr:lactate utilization protein [Sphingobacteriia bacterium]
MSGTLTKAQKFESVSSAKGFDQDHRRKINFNMGRYQQAVSKGVEDYRDLELARDRAAEIRWRAIEHLEANLLRFESAARDNGVKVVWADDATQALDAVLEVLRRHRTKLVVKSKSMVTEEIHLNRGLEKNGIRVVETDLGEYIQQLDEEPPYHIVTPAMHKSKEDVAALFHRKLGTDPHASPEALTLHARNLLRDQYLEAGVGITGANFLLADTGGVGVTENEGNARMSTTFVKSHIVIAGIEKVIESSEDLDLMWPLLASRGTGQQMTAYNTVFHGPRRNSEADGPSEMVVILLDNGRTRLLADPAMRQSLHCIRCGACLNACPIYKNIGGHSYDATYSGPIGKVISPHLLPFSDFQHLSQASTLCGNCTEVCPVRIPLHQLILANRQQAANDPQVHSATSMQRLLWKGWARAMQHRPLLDLVGSRTKAWFIRNFFATAWGHRRHLPSPAPKSFLQQWAERKSG